MKLSELTALSPLDGRYGDKIKSLRLFFSEFALMRYRVLVEIRWLQCLQPQLSAKAINSLENLFENFNEKDAERIKLIEQNTNHDVKAIEYFVKEKIEENSELNQLREWIHFGCTSDDINNLAYGLMLRDAREQIIVPLLDNLLEALQDLAHHYANISMLSRTHGQKATPTTIGKEFANIYTRLNHQIKTLKSQKIYGKINGAVGNFNAHHVVFPDKNWPQIAKNFVEKLGLSYQQYTTQIEPHDYLAEIFQNFSRLNNILIDLSRDVWGYISLEYFSQKSVAGETGSSTMPHKINPIDFENAEGNFGIANAIFEHLSAKLPISRLQRDLTDSTVLRNIGVPMGHTLIGYNSLLKGMNKLLLNETALHNHLEENWAVVAEAIQTVLRREGYPKPYEALKALTRTNKKIGEKDIKKFIDTLKVTAKVKTELKRITPHNYTGVY